MRTLDAFFGHPRGVAGRAGGALMVHGNAPQERWAVDHAGLRPGMTVVVIGPGPGVGLDLAAEAVAPSGHVIGVEPSAAMRRMAAERCVGHIAWRLLELREGTAERTGCPDGSADTVISVNNVMMWDRPAGFREVHRVLRPGGRLVLTVHRHVLDVTPDRLGADAAAAGFVGIDRVSRPRRFTTPAVELIAVRP